MDTFKLGIVFSVKYKTRVEDDNKREEIEST
jgi:hypothetical protein